MADDTLDQLASMGRIDVVVLDTSMLLLPFDKGIDVENELKVHLPTARAVVPTPMINELAHLAAEGRGQSKRHAKMALSYVVRFEEHNIGGKGDDVVIQTGRELEKQGLRVAVATADQPLRFRARKKGWPVLTVKGHRAWVDGYVD